MVYFINQIISQIILCANSKKFDLQSYAYKYQILASLRKSSRRRIFVLELGRGKEPGGGRRVPLREVVGTVANENPPYNCLFQQFAVAVLFEYAHLVDGYFVELYKALGLRQALVDEHGVKALHVGETD